jgi:ATP-binding cassette subfamily B (MDR/TAP) protein 10
MGLRSVAQGVAGVGYMAYMSPQLTATVLGLVPVVLGGAYAYGRFVRGLSTRTQDALSAATAFAEERIANVRTVKAFAQEDAERRRYAERVERVLELGQKEALANGGFFAAASFVGSLCLLAVLFRGGLLVAAGQLTAGVLTSFLLYSLYVGASFLSVSSFYGELMKGLGASHRYFSILGPRDPPQSGERRAAGPTLPNLRGSISFEDVHLQYDQRARVLHGIDLEVPAGKTVAVVGESGAGKSSLAYLLLRFFAPVQGTIRIDGVPLDTLDRDWLRRQIGYVPQEPALFSGTIRDNIAYGVEHCTQEEVERAAREANADIFIRAFPHGYDTLVGERGASLSGGQKQRIAIARAILKNPRILIVSLCAEREGRARVREEVNRSARL